MLPNRQGLVLHRHLSIWVLRMRNRIARLCAIALWLIPFLPTVLTGQTEPRFCPTAPLRLALVFDQSLSTPTGFARNVYPAILSAFYSALQPSDRLLVFRLPDSREREVELIDEVLVTGEGDLPADRIVGEILEHPTQTSDLAEAVRSIAKRFEDRLCRVAVVLITDGSLSPTEKSSSGSRDNHIKLIVDEFRSAARDARKSIELYALGVQSDAHLAIDSTYWPKPRPPVIDDYWDVRLDTLRGNTLLQRTFPDRYFTYSAGAVTELLLFSPHAIFPVVRGYVSGRPGRVEQLIDLYFRASLSNSSCHGLGLPTSYEGLREIGANNDRCVFYSTHPQPRLAHWLDVNRMIDGMAVIYQPSGHYSFEKTTSSQSFRHGFVVGNGSDTCSHRTLLTHLAASGQWPPSVSSGDTLFVAWNASRTRDDSLLPTKDDSLVSIGSSKCLALHDLFASGGIGRGSLRPVVFTDSFTQVSRRPIEPFNRYPISTFVLDRSFLKPSVWRLHGGITSENQSNHEARLLVRGFSFPLNAMEDRSCPQQRMPCYLVNTRITSPEGVRVGVVLLNNKDLYNCGAEDCLPVPVATRYPLLHLVISAVVCFAIAIGLEMLAVRLPRIRRYIAVRAWSRSPAWGNAIVNILSTALWLLLCYMIAIDAVSPGADTLIQVVQVVLAYVGTGILLSLFQGISDVASSYFTP
jgi:hypothetical protein